MATLVERLRADGWMVAVHNDYRFKGQHHTFWLFTRGDHAIKGEGTSDDEALEVCVREAKRIDEAAAEITRLQSELDAKGKRELKVLNLIDKLREPEGHSVTLFCDNPDFNGQPNCAIEVCGDWTGWEDKRFPGDTVLEALEKAHACAVFFPAPPSKPQR